MHKLLFTAFLMIPSAAVPMTIIIDEIDHILPEGGAAPKLAPAESEKPKPHDGYYSDNTSAIVTDYLSRQTVQEFKKKVRARAVWGIAPTKVSDEILTDADALNFFNRSGPFPEVRNHEPIIKSPHATHQRHIASLIKAELDKDLSPLHCGAWNIQHESPLDRHLTPEGHAKIWNNHPAEKKAFAQCMEHGHMNACMACTRVILSLSSNEKASEQSEDDSECVKTCKKEMAATIALIINSAPEADTLFPTARLLQAERQAKRLQEQFLHCMKACNTPKSK